MKVLRSSISSSSKVSRPSTTKAGATTATFVTPRLAKSTTAEVEAGVSHLTGPSRLW